jgi:hypothetical protein
MTSHHINDSDATQLQSVLSKLVAQIADHTNVSNPSEVSNLSPKTSVAMLTQIHETLRLVGEKDGSELNHQVENLLQKLAPSEDDAPGPSLNNGVYYAEQEERKVSKRVADLRQWWLAKSEAEVEMVAAKAVVYGSNSLEQLGRKVAQLHGREVSSEEAQELGCWINLVQKTERWTDAVMRGDRPKDDTLTDVATYATMSLRIRNAGGWPDSEGA